MNVSSTPTRPSRRRRGRLLALALASCLGCASAPAARGAPSSAAPSAGATGSADAIGEPGAGPGEASPGGAVDPLARLAQHLSEGGDWILRRGTFAAAQHRVELAVGVTGGTTWICVALDGATDQCWGLELRPGFAGLPILPPQGAGPASITFMLNDGAPQLVRVSYRHGARPPVTAARVDPMGDTRELPLEPPPARPVPSFLRELSALEVHAAGPALVAAHGSTLMVCRQADRARCSVVPSARALEGGSVQVVTVEPLFDGLWEVTLLRRAPDEVAELALFVRVQDESATVVATVVKHAERRGPAAPDGSREVTLLRNPLVEAVSPDCLVAEEPEVVRVREGGGDASRPRYAPLARAPDRIPADGLDLFARSMEGSWRILDEGGLVRARGCPRSR